MEKIKKYLPGGKEKQIYWKVKPTFNNKVENQVKNAILSKFKIFFPTMSFNIVEIWKP